MGGAHSTHERIVLKFTLKKKSGRLWTGFIWLRIWTNGRLLNEP
jgi:hypothetical protein